MFIPQHVSHVKCHMSGVKSNFFFLLFGQSGGASLSQILIISTWCPKKMSVHQSITLKNWIFLGPPASEINDFPHILDDKNYRRWWNRVYHLESTPDNTDAGFLGSLKIIPNLMNQKSFGLPWPSLHCTAMQCMYLSKHMAKVSTLTLVKGFPSLSYSNMDDLRFKYLVDRLEWQSMQWRGMMQSMQDREGRCTTARQLSLDWG